MSGLRKRDGADRPSAGRRLLRVLARLVPRHERDDWLAEWESELDVLEGASPTGAGVPRGRMRARYPHPITFVLGALPHALWMRKEGWTMGGAFQDLRYAFRVLARAPGFTAAATLTLALGIGANATIFALVNGLVLGSPPGVSEPDRLVQIARSYADAPRWDTWSWPAYRNIAQESSIFSGVAGYTDIPLTIGRGADAEPVSALLVTGDYFRVLGVQPATGRLLQRSDDVTPGGHSVTVLSFELWQRRFGADPDIVGRDVELGGRAYEVVGVAPRAFQGAETLADAPQVFVPTSMHPRFMDRLPFDEWGWSWMSLVGRLADGVSYDRAASAMPRVADRMRAAHSVNDGVQVLLAQGIGLDPEERSEARSVAALLAAVALLVLLLTCANVANLFLARATVRQGEMGVRLALGAARIRLARQLVTESLALGLLAALVAVVPLLLGTRLLPALFPYPITTSLAPDTRVYLSLVGLGLLSGLLFGGAPSVAAARHDLVGAMRSAGSTGATGSHRIRDGLVVLQLTLSLGLLAGASLLGSSVLQALRAEPGFQPRGVAAAAMDLSGTGRYDGAGAAAFGERLAREARGLPGVVAAAVASQAPFLPGSARSSQAPSDRPDDPSVQFEAAAVFVSDRYFETLGIPLLAGRSLRASDEEPEPVAVVSASLAERFWPGQDAVGRHLAGGERTGPVRVVGVVADVQDRSLRMEAQPAVYRPLPASFTQRLTLLVRSGGDPMLLAPALRELVARLDPGLPVLAVESLHERMAASLGTTRTVGVLVGAFAVLALLLSIVGLYGLTAFTVSRRIRELGIRIALGAAPRGLIRLVLRRVLVLTSMGLVCGVALALALGRALQGMLFDVEASDPRALVLASTVLICASLLAAWLPARRASRVDAMVSLRE